MGNSRSKPESMEQRRRHSSETRASPPPQAFPLSPAWVSGSSVQASPPLQAFHSGLASVSGSSVQASPPLQAFHSGTPQPVEELEKCSHDIEAGPPEYCSRKVLMLGGLGLMEPPEVTQWQTYTEIYLMENQLTELAEDPWCPVLSVLFLNRNYKLRTISPSFFNYMPALEILNLSRTRIKSLPESLFRLSCLKRLFLNHCELLMVLPPEIGELQQLEVLDLEGTEIMDLPKEVAKLTKLTCLEVSFCRRINRGTNFAGANALIPQGTISALSRLEELSIDVNPEDERWKSVVEAIVDDVCGLISLDTLKLYLPRVEHLRKFKWFGTSEVSRSLSHFKFIVGSHDERMMSCLPVDLEFELERWDRSLKYVNGVGVPADMQKMLQHTTAFFLDRHTNVTKLSDFGIEDMEQLRCCIIGECNEIRVIIDDTDMYDEADGNEIVLESWEDGKSFLGSLEYLYVYHMKSLRSIYEGPVHQGCLSHLKCLALLTCPRLTTIFTPGLLKNLDSLEELKVEDCPLVLSLVTCEDTSIYESIHFLPNLKRISLFSLPGLISISNGLRIAPNLERMSISDCPNLKSPSTDGICGNHLTVAKVKANLERMSISDRPNLKSPSTDGICRTPLTRTKVNLERMSISDRPNLKSPSTDGICCTPLTWTKVNLERMSISDHPKLKSPSTDGICYTPLTWTKDKTKSRDDSDPKKEVPVPKDGPTAHIAVQTFTFRELAAATKNFRRESLMGEGVGGRVYKGRLESTGQVAAVKQLDLDGLQGKREFLVEVFNISLLHHPNLVKLIGYCADGDQRLLVFEFMPLGSLEDRLHDLPPGKEPLDWNTRMKIAAGAAKGLEYLHDKVNPPVIYRDLKSSNILLDEGFHPKLSNFGFEKLGPVGDKTHVSTRVMGTYAYSAPEYAMTGQLTLKFDVYSFGVVFLELITGRKATDNSSSPEKYNLVAWARPLLRDRRQFPKMADPLLQGRYPMRGLYQALAIAAMCLQEQPATRPLMGDVATAVTYIASQTLDPNSASAQSNRVSPSTPRIKDDRRGTSDGLVPFQLIGFPPLSEIERGRQLTSRAELGRSETGGESGRNWGLDDLDRVGSHRDSPGSAGRGRETLRNRDLDRERAVAEAKVWGENWRERKCAGAVGSFDSTNE